MDSQIKEYIDLDSQIEYIEGELEINRGQNRVIFIAKDYEFQLPLSPADVDNARVLTEYGTKTKK